MGITIDVLFYLSGKYKINFLVIALIGGIAYTIIPLSRIIIHLTSGYEFMSFIKKGYLLPLASHFIFGFTGGLLASSLVSFNKKQLKK